MTTVASHFPSTQLTLFKTTTCNDRVCRRDACVWAKGNQFQRPL